MPLKSTGGRNVYGRHDPRGNRGGRPTSSVLRIIGLAARQGTALPGPNGGGDFEYDPKPLGAQSRLLHYTERREALHPLAGSGVNVGDVLTSRRETWTSAREIRSRCTPSRSARVIHNIELKKGHGAQIDPVGPAPSAS